MVHHLGCAAFELRGWIAWHVVKPRPDIRRHGPSGFQATVMHPPHQMAATRKRRKPEASTVMGAPIFWRRSGRLFQTTPSI